MQIDRAKAENIAREAMGAFQRGDGSAAQEKFAALVEAGHETVPMCLMLARACRLSGDEEAEAAAIDRLLARDPNNIPGLLMRGQLHDRGGDARAAVSFYNAALSLARQKGAPGELAAELREAEGFVQRRAGEFRAAIAEAVKDVDAGRGPEGLRLRHALEMLAGERDIQLQRPSVFYYPYLAQRQYFEREEFDWAPAIEAATADIKRELLALVAEGADFRPYVEAEKDRPHRDFHGLLDSPEWTALYLWKDGRLVEENVARCPKTVAALEQVPLTRIGERTPNALFSRLLPGAQIPPHHGMLNSRLVCHLPLVIPPGCWLRVGNETREWEEGKLLIFDDSMEHEARNPSGETRIILLFDVWRPELGEEERRAISSIFDAIDRFQGVPADR